MANEQHRRLMQEALDEQLSAQAQHELLKQLNEEPDTAAEYQRLRQVDELLRNAPFERAPQRLAMNIMARLTETLQSKEEMSRASGLALALGLALVVLVALPLLVASSWLFLSAVSSSAALNSLMQQIVTLLTLLMGMLEVFLQEAQNLVGDVPQAPLLLVALVPAALFWMLRYLMNEQDKQDENSDAGGAA